MGAGGPSKKSIKFLPSLSVSYGAAHGRAPRWHPGTAPAPRGSSHIGQRGLGSSALTRLPPEAAVICCRDEPAAGASLRIGDSTSLEGMSAVVSGNLSAGESHGNNVAARFFFFALEENT